jgi:hypothetical protein
MLGMNRDGRMGRRRKNSRRCGYQIPGRRNELFLCADGHVTYRAIYVPQTHVIRGYFRAANCIDIHNQYRQGLLAIERTWKTHSWQLRIFQTMMGTVLVNGYLAYKHLTANRPTLREFTIEVALAMYSPGIDDDDDGSIDFGPSYFGGSGSRNM